MRIKTFQGKSLDDLLPEIRAELGAGAVVLGQRQKVEGGIGGFFGTRVLEVTAADRMPSDEQLVDIEGRMQDGTLLDGEAPPTPSGGDDSPLAGAQDALAERFRGAMRMGRVGGIDVTDDWDPATDAALAEEYGRVLETARRTAGVAPTADGRIDVIDEGFTPLAVPTADATAVASGAAATAQPLEQAQLLAQRAHEAVRTRTERVDAVAPNPMATTYAPPAALPDADSGSTTFSAAVVDAGPAPQTRVTPLADDLGGAPAAAPVPVAADVAAQAQDAIAEAIAAAVDVIDVRAMAALRNAMNANRAAIGAVEQVALPANLQHAIDEARAQLATAGVDDDVIGAVIDTAVRHRLPFESTERPLIELVREVVEESIPVHSGYTTIGRSHRAAVVGSPTCGKTSIVQKIAQRYAESGTSVGVIVLVVDQEGVGGAEHSIRSVGIDVRYAASPQQAADAAQAFAHHDLVLVDTPGSTYLDGSVFDLVQRSFAAIDVDDVHVVVPLTTSAREAESIVEAFRPLGANRLVVSRIDESRHRGQLLNFGFRLGLPMTYLSDGPAVPADLHAASPRAITETIMPSAPAGGDTAQETTAS